jgi:two-component system chemotaxis response regulator CheB
MLAGTPSRPGSGPASGVDAVLIGASAGAVTALSVLLPLLPADLEVPVLVVVHLPPRHRSLLAEIFRERCALEVSEAQDKQLLRAGALYFAPPDYHLLVESSGSLALSVEEPVNYSRPSIDVLFESAVEVFGSRLLALILTGANQDGARGAASVRIAGGVVAVQDPRSAEATAMPRAAIERADPQFIGTLPELASFTVRTVRGQAPI